MALILRSLLLKEDLFYLSDTGILNDGQELKFPLFWPGYSEWSRVPVPGSPHKTQVQA